MKFLSKISIIFLFLISTFYLLPSVAHANISPQANYPVANTNPDVPNNLHNWTQNVMIEVMSSLTCQLAGVDPINPKQGCLGADTKTGKIGFLPSPQTGLPDEALAKSGGAIGFMGNMISVLYTPPLHTADYFRDLASNFGISKKTYAENAGGTGFQSLTPLIGVWSAFRNIVYLFLVIIFVVIGLAIMLRVKIDPRTVMTIQNQIPKIIIGILAVTFSFAIAGFLIDMMWVLIYLIINIISSAGSTTFSEITKIAQSTNPFQAAGDSFGIGSILGHSSGAVANITGSLFDNAVGRIIIGVVFAAIGGFLGHLIPAAVPIAGPLVILKPFMNALTTALGGNFSTILTVGTGALFGIGGGILAPLIGQGLGFVIGFIIISIALVAALFRLWFALLMAYVQILLAVVLAPFWIIGGIVPGSPISLSGWLKDIGSNLLAFPVTIAMFMLGKVFMDAFGETQTQGQFIPPLIGNPGDPKLIGSLIGLGILLMTPNVVNMLKQMLKAPKTDMGGVMKGIGAGVGLPVSTIKGAIGLKQGSEEFIIKGYDEKSGKIDYGQRKLGRAILGRFGR